MVAKAKKSINFHLIGLFVAIKARLGLMTLRSVVSLSFNSGSSLFRQNEIAGFCNFWNQPQGSFLSNSRRFLAIPKAKYLTSTSFKALSPNPRILEAQTIDFGFLAPQFRRFDEIDYLLAPFLDGFNIENYFRRHDYSIKYGESSKPSFVSIRLLVLANSCLEYQNRPP